MQEFSAADILFSFLITWIVVLTPPLLIRTLRGKPVDKSLAIGICVIFYFANVILFVAMGSQNKSHAALLLGAWLSYYILRWQTNSSAARLACEERTSPGYDEPQSEGAVQSEIFTPTVQPDTQVTHHRWYQKSLHRPMARLFVSFVPSAIFVFSIILIRGYLETQPRVAPDYAALAAEYGTPTDTPDPPTTQPRAPTSAPADTHFGALVDRISSKASDNLGVAKEKERCDTYSNNPRTGTSPDDDALVDCIPAEQPSTRGLLMNLQDKVPGAALAWLGISAALFALLTTLSILIKSDTNKGWKRLSIVTGTIASILVFPGAVFILEEHFSVSGVGPLVLGLVLGLVTLPLVALLLLGGRNLVVWVKTGFEQN